MCRSEPGGSRNKTAAHSRVRCESGRESCHSRLVPFLACHKIAHPLLRSTGPSARAIASRASPALTLMLASTSLLQTNRSSAQRQHRGTVGADLTVRPSVLVWTAGPTSLETSLNAVAVQDQPVGHDISKQSQTSSRQAGDIYTCDESSGAKWPVLYHGVQHVDSVVPRRDGCRFSGAGPGPFPWT